MAVPVAMGHWNWYRSASRESPVSGGMLREQLNDALKEATLAQDACAKSTVRLIRAALKDRDIAARGKGNGEKIDEAEILSMLQTMIKQRRESIEMYQKGGRPDLAEREANEIEVIQGFLPEQLSEEETAEAVKTIIDEVEASSLKEMGKVMAVLRERHAGCMDFGKASAIAKQQLS